MSEDQTPKVSAAPKGRLTARDARLEIERLRAALEQAQSDPASETTSESLDGAQEIAEEVVGAFTTMHPDVKMNYDQWSDLKEMIAREIMGHADHPGIGAKDLLA